MLLPRSAGRRIRKHTLLANFHCDLNGDDWLCRWRTTIRPLRSHVHDRRHDDRFRHMRGVYRVYLRRTVLVICSSDPDLGNFNRRRLRAIFCGCHRARRPTLCWHGAFGTTWARFCAHGWSYLADAAGRRRAGKLAMGLPRFGDRSFCGGGSDAGFKAFARQSENGRREAVTKYFSVRRRHWLNSANAPARNSASPLCLSEQKQLPRNSRTRHGSRICAVGDVTDDVDRTNPTCAPRLVC